MDVGEDRKLRARCISVLFPTPALPITAIFMSDIPLLDWGCTAKLSILVKHLGRGTGLTGRLTELSTEGLLLGEGGSFGDFPSRRRSEYAADLNSRAKDTETGFW